MKYIEYSLEELEVLREASKKMTEQEMSNVLFGFGHTISGLTLYGSYGGFTFLLYKTGLIKVLGELFYGILAEEHRYCVPQSCVREIMQYYADHQNALSSLSAPDNGSCDGAFSSFFFGKRWISALNIEYHDKKNYELIKKVHPDDFDKWAEIIQAENDIMNSFFAVCDILKKYDVVLEQFRVTVKGVSTTTYSDFMESFHEKHRN